MFQVSLRIEVFPVVRLPRAVLPLRRGEGDGRGAGGGGVRGGGGGPGRAVAAHGTGKFVSLIVGNCFILKRASISIARNGLLRPVPGRLHPHRGLLAAGVGGVVQPQEGKGAAVAGAGGLVRKQKSVLMINLSIFLFVKTRLLLARDRAAAARQDSSGSWSPDEPDESQVEKTKQHISQYPSNKPPLLTFSGA